MLLDTYNDSLDQIWCLWRLRPYPYFGPYGDIAIVAIGIIHDVRPLILLSKEVSGPRNEDSEANFSLK